MNATIAVQMQLATTGNSMGTHDYEFDEII